MTSVAAHHRPSSSPVARPARCVVADDSHDASLLRRCQLCREPTLRVLSRLGLTGVDAEAVFWAAVDVVSRSERRTTDDRVLRAFMLATARNLGVALIRRETAQRRAVRRFADAALSRAAADDPIPDAVLWSEYRERLPHAMSLLDETERLIVEVFVVRQLSTRHAASEVSVPASTLRTRFKAILNKLACQLTSAPGPRLTCTHGGRPSSRPHKNVAEECP